MTTTRMRPLVSALLVLALLAVMHPGPLFQGKVYQSADAQSFDAFRAVGDAARAEGVRQLWNPFIFLGIPSFSTLTYAPGLYPPSVVFDFLQTTLHLPPLTWMLGHLLFGGLGMIWLLGRWRLPLPARLVGAVAWLYFAETVAWAVHGHGTKLGAAMYLPWLVGLAWEVLTRGRLWAVALAGGLLGLQVLRGHIQITYYTLLILAWLAAWHFVWPLDATDGQRPSRAVRGRRVGLLAVALLLGVLVGAVMLLPVHEYAGISTRGQGDAGGGAGFEYATQWSLGARELATLVQPGAVGFGRATYLGPSPFTDYPNYFGWLWLLLAGAAWFSGRRSLVLCLGVLAVLALLLALGNQSPGLYQLFYSALPFFDKFRVPSMVLVVLALAAAVLAGLGTAVLAENTPARERTRRGLAVVLAVIGGLTFLGGATGLGQGAYRAGLTALAGASGKQAAPVVLQEAWLLHRGFLVREGLILLAAAALLAAVQRRPRWRPAVLPWALVVLLAVDLLSVANLITHPDRGLYQVTADAQGGGRLARAAALLQPQRPRAIAPVPPALAEALRQAVGHDRLFPLDQYAQSNDLMTAGVRSLGGYYPAKPAVAEQIRRRLYGQMPSGRIASWLGAAAVSFERALPEEAFPVLRDAGLDLEQAGVERAGSWIYRNRGVMPRARLMDRWRPVSSLASGADLAPLLDAIALGKHDPRAAVVLDREPQPIPAPAAAPLPAPEYVRDGLNEVGLRTRAGTPAILVLADLAAPGWKVEVDGRPRPLLVADLALRAVALEPGTHEVRFHFADPAVERGRALTAAGVAGILALGIAAWLRERKRAA